MELTAKVFVDSGKWNLQKVRADLLLRAVHTQGHPCCSILQTFPQKFEHELNLKLRSANYCENRFELDKVVLPQKICKMQFVLHILALNQCLPNSINCTTLNKAG